MTIVIPTAEGEIEEPRKFKTKAEAEAFSAGWTAGACAYGAGCCTAWVEGDPDLEFYLKEDNPDEYAAVTAAFAKAKEST